MSIWSKIGEAFGFKRFEFTDPEAVAHSILDIIERRSPAQKNASQLLDAFHSVPALYAPIDLTANACAEVPLILKRDGEPVTEHVVLDVLEQPNTVHSGYDFRYLHHAYVDLIGECPVVIMPSDEIGTGVELLPVPGPWVTREKIEGRLRWCVRMQRRDWVIPDEHMIFTTTPNLADPYGRGRGYGHVLMDEIDIDEYAADFEKAEFYNHARPSVVVRLEGANKDARRAFKEDWLNNYRGARNAGKVMVVGGARDFELTEVGRSLKDTLITELRKYSADVMAQTIGIPPEMLGRVENSNRATITASRTIFAERVQKPRLRRFVSSFMKKIMPMLPDSDGLVLGFDDPTPQNTEILLQFASSNPECMTVNERRAIVGLPPRDDGDVYLRPPTNQTVTVPAADITEAAAPKAAPPKKNERALSDIIVRFPRLTKGELTESDAAYLIEQLRPERISSATRDVYEAEVLAWGRRTLETLGVDPEAFELLNPFAAQMATEYAATRVVNINETTRKKLNNVIVAGIENGDGIRDIREAIKSSFEEEITNWRADTIARTEMLRASNAAKQKALEIGGIEKREWIATLDDVTRDSHAGMDGQIRGVNEPFDSPNGGQAMYPGGFGDPAEDINCRCTTAAVIDTKDGTRAAIWKAYDEDLTKSEDRYREALSRGFADQLTDVLDAFDELNSERAA